MPTEHEVKEAVFEILEPEKPSKPAEDRAARRRRLLGSLRAAVQKRSWKTVEKVLGELEAADSREYEASSRSLIASYSEKPVYWRETLFGTSIEQ